MGENKCYRVNREIRNMFCPELKVHKETTHGSNKEKNPGRPDKQKFNACKHLTQKKNKGICEYFKYSHDIRTDI